MEDRTEERMALRETLREAGDAGAGIGLTMEENTQEHCYAAARLALAAGWDMGAFLTAARYAFGQVRGGGVDFGGE